MSKTDKTLKVVYIDTGTTPNKIRQSLKIVNAALEMLAAGRYPVDKIIVEIPLDEETDVVPTCGCKTIDQKLFWKTGIAKCIYCGKEDKTLEKK